jgi:PAS domain S-box-containing protein
VPNRETSISESGLTAVLDNAAAAICLIDEQHQCVYMNAAAEALTGYSLADLTGRRLYEVIRPTRPGDSQASLGEFPIARALAAPERTQGEDVFVRSDGESYPVAFIATPLRDRNRDIAGTILELQDITAEKNAWETRDLLIRGINHRAKNVLAAAQGIARLTKAKDLAEYRTAILGRIDALARAQTLLAHERWEGALLAEVLRDEANAQARPEAFTTMEGPNLLLSADAVQPVGLMLHELATNTAKYGALSTPAGKVDLSWSVKAGGELEIVWRESGGPKIAPPGNVGFGSSLLRQLARQLGGDVVLDWREDGLLARLIVGAKAFSPAPFVSSAQQGSSTARTAPDEKSRRGRVLVLEDNVTIGLGMRHLLADAGLDVVGPAMNLDEAIGYVLNSRIDAAFLDIELYGYPSFEVADTLAGKGIPFVFCTGYGGAVRGSRHEGRRILRKPVTDEEVLAAFDQMIDESADART